MASFSDHVPKTTAEDLEHNFQVVNRALKVLSACTQAVIRATDELVLLQTLCQLITEEATYRMAWIGYVCHDEAKSVQPIAWAGYEADYLRDINITWADTERGQGPTGRAIRAGHPIACQNMLQDPKFAPWRAAAQQRGYQSSLVMPLCDGEEVFGALNIYSAEADAFNSQELQLLAELTDSLSFGILTLRAKQKQQQIEAALRLSEDKFSKTFYSSPTATCIVTLESRLFLDVNHGFERLFGYDRSDVIGRTAIELGMWLEGSDRHQMLQRLLEQGSLRNYELTLQKRNGNQFLCHFSAELLHVQDTQCILAVIEDITDRRQTELKILQLNEELEHRVEERTAALQKSQEFLQLLADSIPACIIYLDADRRHQFINHTYEVWFKLSPAEVLGKTIPEVVGGEVYEGIRGYFDRALSGEAVTYEYCFDLEPTAPRMLQVTVLPDWDHNEQVKGCVVLISDITNLKLVEQELQRSNQELGQFAYVASHDLQEPLRAVTGYTQLLMDEYGDRFDETAQSYADFVIDGAKRMQQLIQDLLAYSRVGTRGKEFAPTDCNVVVQEALRNLQVAIAESKADITFELLPILNADRNQLVQLFQNLIGNAIKFCKQDHPCISIRATRRETDYLFQVEDNGIGIKPQYLDRIFEVFKRLHTRREYPGTGIGLAICKKIVLRHGGHIWVESTFGLGTTFFFTIPVDDFEEQL